MRRLDSVDYALRYYGYIYFLRCLGGLIHMLRAVLLQEDVFFLDRMTAILLFFAFPANRCDLLVGNMRL